ncbi:YLS9 protein [Nymphaea thermarum]|nr:YLS9 protein [Nymphaea thermarum]
MADQQRVYPYDVEARPTAPLAPRSALISEKGDPSTPPRIPSYGRRPPPLIFSPPPRRSSNSCCRCLCCFFCVLLVLAVAIAAAAFAIYLIFQPKLPDYSVDRLRLTAFQITPGFPTTLYSQFVVSVTATNPNKKIGIYYESGSRLSVWYTNTSLSTGQLPVFYQGHRNTTVLNVVLTGQNEVGSGLQTALAEQQQTGQIPLDFYADVPVKVELGSLKLRKVIFRVYCSLVVDSLTVDGRIGIKANDCSFRLKL